LIGLVDGLDATCDASSSGDLICDVTFCDVDGLGDVTCNSDGLSDVFCGTSSLNDKLYGLGDIDASGLYDVFAVVKFNNLFVPGEMILLVTFDVLLFDDFTVCT
jgi:hypothetical protein